jgi:hypothetical protein
MSQQNKHSENGLYEKFYGNRTFTPAASATAEITDQLNLASRARWPFLHRRPATVSVYLRPHATRDNIEVQMAEIEDYCHRHGYRIAHVFKDLGLPGMGLQEVLARLDEADGLVVIGLDCFVEHSSDRLRDLRPLLRHFLNYAHKHLIAVNEGIDSSTVFGQESIMDLMSMKE